MLIGHGSYDGVEYKFNIPGPDLTGAEIASMLDHVPATRQLVVVTTSSSGGSIESLRRAEPRRDYGDEGAGRRRMRRCSRGSGRRPCAIRRRMRTRTKRSRRSRRSTTRRRKTTEFFDTQKRLATEHSVLEDTGKGEGERDPEGRERRRETGGDVCGGAPRRERGGGAGSRTSARCSTRKSRSRTPSIS